MIKDEECVTEKQDLWFCSCASFFIVVYLFVMKKIYYG